jgi:hypothetical protein
MMFAHWKHLPWTPAKKKTMKKKKKKKKKIESQRALQKRRPQEGLEPSRRRQHEHDEHERDDHEHDDHRAQQETMTPQKGWGREREQEQQQVHQEYKNDPWSACVRTWLVDWTNPNPEIDPEKNQCLLHDNTGKATIESSSFGFPKTPTNDNKGHQFQQRYGMRHWFVFSFWVGWLVLVVIGSIRLASSSNGSFGLLKERQPKTTNTRASRQATKPANRTTGS